MEKICQDCGATADNCMCINEPTKMPDKIFAFERVGSNGIHCLDYRDSEADVEYIRADKHDQNPYSMTLLQNILNHSGYQTSSFATDEDGYSHKIVFSRENNSGEIHTDNTGIVYIQETDKGEEVGEEKIYSFIEDKKLEYSQMDITEHLNLRQSYEVWLARKIFEHFILIKKEKLNGKDA